MMSGQRIEQLTFSLLPSRGHPAHQKTMEETGLDPVPPRGFVYHETRCGSTLVANMLAAPSSNRVFSESKPPVQVCCRLLSLSNAVNLSRKRARAGENF